MDGGFQWLRSMGLATLLGVAGGGSYIAVEALSPWPPVSMLKHVAALAGCDTAHGLGLTPARRGEPGYWSHHDGDDDGVACERWQDDDDGPSGRRRRASR